MCGRYALISPTEAIREVFSLAEELVLAPRYNIAPTQSSLCVRLDSRQEHREPVRMRWGLVPSWAKDTQIAARLINARSETASEKPAFRSAFQRRRCLVIADGFYEWAKLPGGRKQPHFFRLATREPFAFAGLWEAWGRGTDSLETFTILTTEANEVVRPIHPRMPVILPPHHLDAWLDPSRGADDQRASLLVPYDSALLEAFPVGPAVNHATHDEPDCLEPL